MHIRKFAETDAKEVSDLIIRTLMISNTKDYPAEMMLELTRRMQPEDILERARWTHFYVAEECHSRVRRYRAVLGQNG